MTDVNLTDLARKIVRLNELQEKLQERKQQLREIIDDIQNIKTEIENLYNYYCFSPINYSNG